MKRMLQNSRGAPSEKRARNVREILEQRQTIQRAGETGKAKLRRSALHPLGSLLSAALIVVAAIGIIKMDEIRRQNKREAEKPAAVFTMEREDYQKLRAMFAQMQREEIDRRQRQAIMEHVSRTLKQSISTVESILKESGAVETEVEKEAERILQEMKECRDDIPVQGTSEANP